MMVACLLHSLTFPPSPSDIHNPTQDFRREGQALQEQRGPSFSSLGLLVRDPHPPSH